MASTQLIAWIMLLLIHQAVTLSEHSPCQSPIHSCTSTMRRRSDVPKGTTRNNARSWQISVSSNYTMNDLQYANYLRHRWVHWAIMLIVSIMILYGRSDTPGYIMWAMLPRHYRHPMSCRWEYRSTTRIYRLALSVRCPMSSPPTTSVEISWASPPWQINCCCARPQTRTRLTWWSLVQPFRPAAHSTSHRWSPQTVLITCLMKIYSMSCSCRTLMVIW